MKKLYFFLFLVYFFLCSVFLITARLVFLPSDGLEDQYAERYAPQESFLSLEIESGKQVPFLRIHRDITRSENITDDTYNKEGQNQTGSQNQQKEERETKDERSFIYIFPPEYYQQVSDGYLLDAISSFLKIPSIESTLQNIMVLLFPEDSNTRGRMFQERIYLYSLDRIPQSEVFSVFVHEFGHYHDIYGFPPTRFGDISERFYEISWIDTDIIRAGQGASDFVSGYAMTNMYEDFAESYTYYILHNAAFREKKHNNPILAQKYKFFETYTFPKKEFYNRNFATEARILPYYWDITKIEIDVEKFLQYVFLYL